MNPMKQKKCTNLFPVIRYCGAKTRAGTPCKNRSMQGKSRCRLHGGKSTGPKTQAGLKNSKKANWKHGKYSTATKTERRQETRERKILNRLLDPIIRGKGKMRPKQVETLLLLLEKMDGEKVINPKQLMQINKVQRRLLENLRMYEK